MMKAPVWIFLALTWGVADLHAEDPPEPAKVGISIHDDQGFTTLSAQEQRLSIVLSEDTPTLHLRISNLSGEGLNLWKPYCPPGDEAIRFEFREPANPGIILTAKPEWDYTGPGSSPSLWTLASGDDRLVRVNFTKFWGFPIRMTKGETKEMEIRAIYESARLDPRSEALYESLEPIGAKPLSAKSVWVGIAASPWSKVTISNRTGKAIGPQETAQQGSR